MSWQFSIFGNIFFGISIIAAIVTVKAWRRSFPGNSFFVLFISSALFWAFTSALEWYVALPSEKALWSQISYFGIVNVAPAWFCFSLLYCELTSHLTRRTVLLLWIIPFITLLLALTNSYHGLNWPSYNLVEHPLGNYMFYEHGPSFWVLTVYSYVLNILSSIILVRQSARMFSLYQKQSMILFISVVIPWIGNVLYNARLVTIIDLTPIAFTFTGGLLLWNMKQYRLFDIAPLAREVMFTNIREIAIVLDAHKRVVDMNPFALEHFHLYKSPAGASMNDIFRQWTELLAFVRADNIAELELPYSYSDRTRWFLVSRSPLYDAFQKPAGMLIICRDITRRKKIEQEREQLIDDLQDALANVKTLSGMLPICSNCKKIRDDEGYWNQVEGYIAKYTGAEFTHGICPDCAKKTLDEYFLTKKKRSDYDSSSLIS